jgi:hypothetical protein
MQLASRLGCERGLGELDLRRAVALAQHQARNRLAVVGVGRLPTKRLGQARDWFNLDVLASQVEELALGLLHRDAVRTTHSQIEGYLGAGEPPRPPPLGDLLKIGLTSCPCRSVDRRGTAGKITKDAASGSFRSALAVWWIENGRPVLDTSRTRMDEYSFQSVTPWNSNAPIRTLKTVVVWSQCPDRRLHRKAHPTAPMIEVVWSKIHGTAAEVASCRW